MSSNDPTVGKTVEPIKPVRCENKLKGGGKIEIDDKYLVEVLPNFNLTFL